MSAEPAASALQSQIASELETLGRPTPYTADANEPDARYQGYGVRAPEMRQFIKAHRLQLNELSQEAALELVRQLIASGFGEQKTVALYLLERHIDYFQPDRFSEVEDVFRRLHGWSKIDAYTGSFLKALLTRFPDEVIALLRSWNSDADMWLRRASVVLFTRKVAAMREHHDTALEFCEQLKHDPEDLVRKGVGWCLKDLLKSDPERIINYVIELRRQNVSSTITLYALRDVKGAKRKEILSA